MRHPCDSRQAGPEVFWGGTEPLYKAPCASGVQAGPPHSVGTQETSAIAMGGSNPPKMGGQGLPRRLHKRGEKQ